MAHIPNPLIFGPANAVTLTVTDQRGGLAGYILTSISGPEAVVTLNGDPLSYPSTLKAGDVLKLSRGSGAELTMIDALAPIDDTPPPAGQNLRIMQNPDGSLSSDDPRITSNPDGSLSAPDTLVTVNSDGSLSEV